ncbi:MAG TPA: hypothetical protein VFS77_20640, partial [Pyrinomonadaceae bacterium]|nr:hypothetical protein [Pyrinomonadaceae bacterium]
SRIVTFALGANVIRTLGGSIKPLVIPRGTVLVRLTVDVEKNDFPTYDVALQQAGGSEVWRQTLSKATASLSETQLEVNLPASVFANGNYSLRITASHPGSKEEILALHPIKVINRDRPAEKTERR